MKQGSDRNTTNNINNSLRFGYVGFGQSFKRSLLVFIGFYLLASCAYKPVVDTAGRSGTFNENKAHEITNDIQHCKKLAKNNTSFAINAEARVSPLKPLQVLLSNTKVKGSEQSIW